MSDPRDAIEQIIATAEREAYARGWREAIAALAAKAAEMQQPAATSERSKAVASAPPHDIRRGRPSKASGVIRDIIYAAHGLTGVEVVKRVTGQDGTIPERTVRTCLRRLRIKKEIFKRADKWYPKNPAKAENQIGGAHEALPH